MEKHQVKITIITINFNNCEGLGKTIDSVVSQSCHDYEYIVIDGGSTDGSVNVIKDNADNIDYWVSEKDDGIYNAMNKGIDHATGEYCLFLNSGDTLHDCEVIASVVPVLEADIVVGAIRKCTSGYVKRLFKDVLGTALFDDFKRMYARKYDFFYAKLHLCKYYKIIYTLSVLCIRTLAFLRPTARFARKSPLFIK